MGKKTSKKLSAREIARRQEQAKAREADDSPELNALKTEGGGTQAPPKAKQFRHQGR